MRNSMLPAGMAALLAIWPAPALADAIDGDWCSPDQKHMSIDGPRIKTPGGNTIDGNYSRHAFTYVIPEDEPQPGKSVQMVLLSDEMVRVTAGDNEPRIWRRCELTS